MAISEHIRKTLTVPLPLSAPVNGTFTFDSERRPGNDLDHARWRFQSSNVTNGLARTMYLTRRENAKCISAVTATKQLP